MAELTTKYLGLTLKNPIIIGASGLSDSLDNICELEKNGAGAVVLKSLFEEQIILEADASRKNALNDGMIYMQKSESMDYLDLHIKEDTVNDYIKLIKESKQAVHIPIIASVNCVSGSEWISFAKQIEKAGADALELNIALLAADNKSGEEREKIYFNIIEKVRKEVKIPVAIKIGPYFSNLSNFIHKLSDTGVSGIVLFNRFYNPDFDIDTLTEKSANTFSCPFEYSNALRWVALMSGNVKTDLCASSGIHEGSSVIKQLLAGAKSVQIVSTLYKHGLDQLPKITSELEEWMDKMGYNYIDQFRGKMSQRESKNPEVYERIQFMKYFSDFR